MKGNVNYEPLLISIILILSGIISSSNGIDDSIHRTPQHVMYVLIICIALAVSFYLILTLIENYKKSKKAIHPNKK
jgi:hypothetical protein